ncbi:MULTISPECIES: glycoside hydrolase family 3 protein [Microbacterium]|uniref:glycoside hydrolase family 3 protein n=1 Tax=Microbacterium TaxID=33882 RepID=UPI001C587DDD|nr:glycoside hydrolase family 3 N-terminal domain-containing protein [Microbacterium resistens]MBW1638865.1 glycoside hydrolase family 3 protein [Microbacterium resistens]MDA4893390.1 glycoside hydrolase family 3 C-terminal domain-containing protein [Streptomyces sp. MS2A]
MTQDEVRFPYQDAALPVEQRVEDVLSRMDAADKAGMLFHTMVAFGDPSVGNPTFGIPSAESMVRKRRMNHFNILGAAPDGREFAAWHNALQRVAREDGLGIPLTFSTDPRHAFSDNPLTSILAGPFSQWPETLGFAALRSPERLQRFGDIARQEYLAVGLRVALHPQIDLATEPRWSRINGTFGEDADLTSALVVGYIRGFQGEELGPDSVATMVKHFPGGGPQLDGEDPHFEWGKEQVYPGGAQEYHLRPFIAAIGAGATQMMPYYGKPVGTDWEEVGFGFNKDVLTDLLRDRLGFEGIVCTDWGLLTDAEILGTPMPARAWGLEHLTRPERMVKALDAGVDQFGGELCTDVLLDLLGSGAVSEERLDVSVRRLLREKFRLGLFDDPFVDEDRAEAVVGRADFVEEGLAAQSDSLTLLTNTDAILPLSRGVSVYAEGVDAEVLGGFATVVATPEEADVAILRIKAPFEDRDRGGFSAMFHSGSLEFPAEEHARLTRIAETVPTVIDVYLDRPAVLGGLEESARAVLADYGASDQAVLAVLFGDRGPQGALPFDLPRSDAAVIASRSDVAFDTEDPTFRFGHGLRY